MAWRLGNPPGHRADDTLRHRIEVGGARECEVRRGDVERNVVSARHEGDAQRANFGHHAAILKHGMRAAEHEPDLVHTAGHSARLHHPDRNARIERRTGRAVSIAIG